MLHIVVGAVEPLTLDEINTAWAVKIGHMLTEEESKERMFLSPQVGVREVCGLFVQIVQGKVVLVHQTAREFLVRTTINTSIPPAEPTCWKWSLDPGESAEMLAGICATYLMSNTVKPKPIGSGLPWMGHLRKDPDFVLRLAERPFLTHAAIHLPKYVENLPPTSQASDLYTELHKTYTHSSFRLAIVMSRS